MPVDQKSLWKALVLEHLHNCFIGISHLSCSEPNCPLVNNWDDIEEKNSKKGKCAFLKITQEKFLVVQITKSSLNGLKELVEVEIQYEDKSTALVRNAQEIAEMTKNLTPEQKAQLKFIDPSELVYFFNNPTRTANLMDAEIVYLNSLWETKQKIKWDQDKSKKKVFLHVENEPAENVQANQIADSEKDYLFYVADPSITNPIKKMEVYSPGTGTQERQQLWKDYQEELSELKEFFGIRHNTGEKEERQNNPEIDMIRSPFFATERRKKRIREESIREAEIKQFCPGKHILSYGSLQEHQQEIMLAEQVENLEQGEEVKEENHAPEETKQIPFIKET